MRAVKNAAFIRLLEKNGWVVIRSKKHYILRHPQATKNLVVAKSPSDNRTNLNVLKEAERLIKTR